VNVALLNPCYWPEVRRGSERFARELADGLIARGHRPRLVTSHPRRSSSRVEDGMEVVRSWRPPDARLRRRQWEDHLTHLPSSYLALRRGRDDVAHALYPTDALAALAWKARTGRPVILSFMGIPHRSWLAARRGRTGAIVRAMRGADAVVALSETAAAAFERWLGLRPRVIAPGVDLQAFAPGPGRAPAPTILCAADHTQPRKRVGLLVEAFALVRREHPDARLVLSRVRGAAAPSGAGIEERDLDDRATLAGANREAWVAALPSIGEAFGLVALEALACGTPVVASDREALPEVVDSPRIGRVFAGGEPAALAAALLEALDLARDPETSPACRARAELFSTGRCADAYVALYEEVIAGARQR
jgi:glycosyltransferase involved in cell wall biosynthesis